MLDKPDDRRNLLKVVLVGQNTWQRAEICSALAELSEPEMEVAEAEPRPMVALNGSGGVDVAMVMLEGGEESAIEYLQGQAQLSPRPALFALLHDRSTSLMRRVLRAGADEVLFLPLDHGDATRALLKISEARRRVERPGRGQILALVSLTGGVGVTTLSANLALDLRHLSQKQVASVDLDLQTSDLSVVLNLEPEHTIVDICDPVRKLDSIRLESALSKHASGVYLLAAPNRIEDGEIVTAVQVGEALDLMRQLFDFVVVDCGRHISENTVAVWERCDHLFYVLDQSIGAVRCAGRFIDLFGRLDLAGVVPAFLLNRYLPRNPITEEQIAYSLARPVFAKIARDDKTCEQAVTKAQDLKKVAPHSPLTKDLEELARKLSGASTEATTGRNGGLLSRLFSSTNG